MTDNGADSFKGTQGLLKTWLTVLSECLVWWELLLHIQEDPDCLEKIQSICYFLTVNLSRFPSPCEYTVQHHGTVHKNSYATESGAVLKCQVTLLVKNYP